MSLNLVTDNHSQNDHIAIIQPPPHNRPLLETIAGTGHHGQETKKGQEGQEQETKVFQQEKKENNKSKTSRVALLPSKSSRGQKNLNTEKRQKKGLNAIQGKGKATGKRGGDNQKRIKNATNPNQPRRRPKITSQMAQVITPSAKLLRSVHLVNRKPVNKGMLRVIDKNQLCEYLQNGMNALSILLMNFDKLAF